MDFITAVKTCFKKYFTFSGRARRSEFWWFVLFTFIVGFILGIIETFVFGSANPISTTGSTIGYATGNGPLSTIFNLAVFVPTLSAGFRRLHDTGRSGWWVGGWFLAIFAIGFTAGFMGVFGSAPAMGILPALLMILWIVWAVTLIVFYCLDSHKGDNQYGPSPKYGGQASAFD